MSYSAKPDRKLKRAARELAKQRGISYVAARRELERPRLLRTYDLAGARRLQSELLDEGAFSVSDLLAGEIVVGERVLEDLAAMYFDEEITRKLSRGIGLLRRSATLAGLKQPPMMMPDGYPAAAIADAHAYIASKGARPMLDVPSDDPGWPDLAPEHTAAAMLMRRPRRMLGEQLIAWLGEDHPDRLAILAGIEWRSRPAPLPPPSAGLELLERLDSVDAAGLVDAGALEAARRVTVEWVRAEAER